MKYQKKRFRCLTMAVLAVLYAYLGDHAVRAQSANPDDAGRSTFIAKGCAGCHSIYGFAIGPEDPKGGPDLGKRKVYGTYMELAASMWNHFPKMLERARKQGVKIPVFTEMEVADVISYLAFIRYKGQPGHERTGRKLLRKKGCNKCHEFGGQGGNIGPDITDSEEYLTPLSLASAMWNHGPDMMDLFLENNIERPDLNGREIVDLSAGIRSFMMPSRVAVGSDRPGDPERGRERIKEKQCDYCHGGPKAAKNAPLDFRDMDLQMSVTEIAGKMWNHGPSMWDSMREEGVDFPALSAIEMADIISYLYELKLHDSPGDASRGAELIYDKGCINCHSIEGKGAGVGPSFNDIGDLSSPLSMISRMWNHAEDMNDAVRDQGRRWPTFDGQELSDIHAYLRLLENSRRAQ